ncbi:netrin receptor UNC5B-like isoform X2 [Liolophura sinensis]|uniref:netrin receptor UNC5B-like isoform X2 n=1 Tax=Liolophura sinensis TaxID=3198878 RepID=UPI0031580297
MANNSTSEASTPLSGAAVAAIVLGIIVALLLVVIGVLVYCVCRYRWRLVSRSHSSRTLNYYETPMEILPIPRRMPDNENVVDPSPEPVFDHVIKKTTVQLWGRQATIVGNTKTLSQVYSASQSYFSKQGKLRKDENFTIPSNRLTIHSVLFSTDLPKGQLSDIQLSDSQSTVGVPSQRPTSYINLLGPGDTASAHSQVPYIGQKEIFKHAVLGATGGSIELSGIRLEVPEGALAKDIEISIGVTWDTNKYPPLSTKEALLSPVVVCEPLGTVFTKAVKLSFPHCALDDLRGWMPKLMCSQNRIDSTPHWKMMTIADYSERSFANKVVSVGIKHFTLYTLVAEPKADQRTAKDVKLLAFAPPLKTGKLHKIRIYCVENYEKELQDIQEEEVDLGGRRVHPKKSIFIYNTGENLCLENHLDSSLWNLIGDQSVELQYEQIWHGLTPNHEFAFTTKANADVFHSKFVAYQKAYESQVSGLEHLPAGRARGG